MLPLGYRWEEQWGGQALYLDGVAPYPCRCAYWSPLPGGGGVLLHWGVRDCMPNQRAMATAEGATRFAEAWAIKWDAEIRRHVGNKGAGDRWKPPPEEISKAAATRDLFRRKGHRKNWWKDQA